MTVTLRQQFGSFTLCPALHWSEQYSYSNNYRHYLTLQVLQGKGTLTVGCGAVSWKMFRRVVVPSCSGCHSSAVLSCKDYSVLNLKPFRSLQMRPSCTKRQIVKSRKIWTLSSFAVTDWLTDWLTDRLTDWLNEWLTDWQTSSSTEINGILFCLFSKALTLTQTALTQTTLTQTTLTQTTLNNTTLNQTTLTQTTLNQTTLPQTTLNKTTLPHTTLTQTTLTQTTLNQTTLTQTTLNQTTLTQTTLTQTTWRSEMNWQGLRRNQKWFNLLVTRCINKFNIRQLYAQPHCIYVLCKQRLVPLTA
jgi:hypothetical protein